MGFDPSTLQAIQMGLSAGGAVSSAYGAYSTAQSQRLAAEIGAERSQRNAAIAEWQAADALSRGNKDALRISRRAAQVKGAQRARLAASGVDLASGSPLALLEDTDMMSEADIATARTNSEREAFAYRTRASGDVSDAALLRARGRSVSPGGAAFTSLLSSSGTISDRWYRYRSGRQE